MEQSTGRKLISKIPVRRIFNSSAAIVLAFPYTYLAGDLVSVCDMPTKIVAGGFFFLFGAISATALITRHRHKSYSEAFDTHPPARWEVPIALAVMGGFAALHLA